MDRQVLKVLDAVGHGRVPHVEGCSGSEVGSSSRETEQGGDRVAAWKGEYFRDEGEAGCDAGIGDFNEDPIRTCRLGFGSIRRSGACRVQRIGSGGGEVECGGSDSFRRGDADYVTFDVLHANGDGADKIKGVAKATSDEVFVGRWVGSWKGTLEDSGFAVGFEETQLFDKTGVANGDETGKRGAGFGKSFGDSGSLVGVWCVRLGETV